MLGSCLVSVKALGGYYSPGKLSLNNFYLHAIRWKLFWFLVYQLLTVFSSCFHSLSWQFNQSNLEAVFIEFFLLNVHVHFSWGPNALEVKASWCTWPVSGGCQYFHGETLV